MEEEKPAEYDYVATLPDGFIYRLAEFTGSRQQYRAVFTPWTVCILCLFNNISYKHNIT